MSERESEIYMPKSVGQEFVQIYQYIPDNISLNTDDMAYKSKKHFIENRRRKSVWNEALHSKLDVVLSKTMLTDSAQLYLLEYFPQLYVIGKRPEGKKSSRPQMLFDVVLQEVTQNPDALVTPSACKRIDVALFDDAKQMYDVTADRIKSGFVSDDERDEFRNQHARLVNWINDVSITYSALPDDDSEY